MREAVNCLEIFIHVFAYSFFFHEILSNKRSLTLLTAGCFGIEICLHLLDLFSLLPYASYKTLRLLLPFLMIFYFFKQSTEKKAAMFVVFIAISLMSDLSGLFISRKIFSSDNDGTIRVLAGKLLTASIMLITMLMIVIVVKYRRKRSFGQVMMLIPISGYSLAYAIYLTAYFRINSGSITLNIIFIQLLFQALIFVMLVLHYYNSLKVNELARKKSQAMAAEAERQSRQRYIDLAESKLREITELKKAMISQLSDVQRLMAQDNTGSAANESMDDMSKQLNSIRVVNYCDDHIINAVLTIKLNEERVKDINIQTLLRSCSDSGIDNYEMCSIVSNMMDNAVESCLKMPDPSQTFIEIKSGIAAGYFVIKVTNSCGETFAAVSDKGEGHGYGLKIVNEICRRHNGEFKVTQKGSAVVSTAFLKVDV